ncbi:MAG: hypothetical protein US76_02745 [Parcubacteria group bacterium GW2011_GWA2_38_13b]|nr:MAG: hypothetical protein US76_02745 [Parcubacteria group bacterium GW2011_GWA2_38_13b]
MYQSENDNLIFLFLFLVAIWTLPWKGIALWKAARGEHRIWFIVLLIANTLALLEILYIFIFSKKVQVIEAKKP